MPNLKNGTKTGGRSLVPTSITFGSGMTIPKLTSGDDSIDLDIDYVNLMPN